MEANALYFAIGVLAYNLGQVLKRRVLPASYRMVTVATLPWKVYRLAGKRVRHARGWMLQIRPTWKNGCYCNPHGSAAPRCGPEPRRKKGTRRTTARRCPRVVGKNYLEDPWAPES